MAKTATATRSRVPKDHSPVWDGHENWTEAEFLKKFHMATEYYRLEFSGKDLKPAVLKWMTDVGCTKTDIAAFKKTKDGRCNVTMGAIASCLLRGMPSIRADFNKGRDTAAWLRNEIVTVIEAGKNDIEEVEAKEAKANRKPKARKLQPKEKIVAKMKYMKSNEPLKLVSINPTDIIGAKELWVFNTKTRKLGKYVAAEYQDLGVKGTTITGFNEHTSICKTLRKPEEKLKEFKSAGKVQLRKFLDDINATDTKMNGRINEEIVLLKVV